MLAENLGNPERVESYIRELWRVVADPIEAEYVRTPMLQLAHLDEFHNFEGDCDDASTLAASLLAALLIPCELIAIRMPNEEDFSHVWCRSMGVDIDPIVPLDALPITGYAETMRVTVI